jgi:hypothetical protein
MFVFKNSFAIGAAHTIRWDRGPAIGKKQRYLGAYQAEEKVMVACRNKPSSH